MADVENEAEIDLEGRLKQHLGRLPGCVVAFSGGVDSSYLLWAAREALGSARVRAILGVSPSVSRSQVEQAERVARMLGVTLTRVQTTELEDERYRRNLGDRCYFCKDTLFRALGALDAPAGWAILDGTNRDDLDGHRPGRDAAREQGVSSPLAELGFRKEAIRRLSRIAGLPTAELPASPCLASRFPAGTPVTVEGLERVEAAEDFLRSLGFSEFRVRHHGELARIEALPSDIARLLDPELRSRVATRLRALGYRFVSVDLEDFRSGRGSTAGA